MSAMPQLNEVEHRLFESGGQEMAPSLSEALPAHTEPAVEAEAPTDAGERADAKPTAVPEKEMRQEKLVPPQPCSRSGRRRNSYETN